MQEPTYLEYQRASKFARFRYKYGIFVLICCWLLLLFLIFYIINNVEEMKSADMRYCVKKARVYCTCYGEEGDSYFVNSTVIKELNIGDFIWEHKTS